MRRRFMTRDSGLGLPELLVTMMIVSLVLVVAGTILVSTTRQYRSTVGKVDTHADSRTLMEAVTRDLRMAVPNPDGGDAIVDGGPHSLTFYTAREQANTLPSLITYSVDPDNGCLRRTIIQGTRPTQNTIAYPTSSATSRCVAFSRVDTSQPVFNYQTVAPGGAQTPISLPADKAIVASVTVHLTLTSSEQPEAVPTTVERSVTLINLSTHLLKG